MRFSFYITANNQPDTVKKAVMAALVNAGSEIGENLEVDISDDITSRDNELRVDFGLKAHGTVDADVTLDVVDAVDGVSRTVFRRKGKHIATTITELHA